MEYVDIYSAIEIEWTIQYKHLVNSIATVASMLQNRALGDQMGVFAFVGIFFG